MVTVAHDTFVRANQTGWGTGTDGKVWTQSTGTDTWAISSNTGVLTDPSSGGNDNWLVYGSSTIGTCYVLARIKASNWNNQPSPFLRGSGSPNTSAYTCGFNFTITNAFEIVKYVSNAPTSLANTSFTPTANTYYWFKIQAQGSSIKAKYWQDGNSEPSTWTLSVTDTTYTTGKYGIQTYASSTSGTISVNSFTVDDLTVASTSYFRAYIGKHWKGIH